MKGNKFSGQYTKPRAVCGWLWCWLSWSVLPWPGLVLYAKDRQGGGSGGAPSRHTGSERRLSHVSPFVYVLIHTALCLPTSAACKSFLCFGISQICFFIFRDFRTAKNSAKVSLLSCTYVLMSPAACHLVHRGPHMANSSVSSFLTDTKQTCKNSDPPWVQDVKILRCWDPQTFRYLDARMPRYVFQTRMWCFHENSNRNSVMERWIHMCSVLRHKTSIYNIYLLIFLSKQEY